MSFRQTEMPSVAAAKAGFNAGSIKSNPGGRSSSAKGKRVNRRGV
jgi:hypothetical protein